MSLSARDTPRNRAVKNTNALRRSGAKRTPFFNPERSFFRPARAIQPKLTVNAPNDIYEKEADAVADKVMHMPDPQVQRQSSEEEEGIMMKMQKPAAQRKDEEMMQRQPVEDEEEMLQMQSIKEEEEMMLKAQPPTVQRACAECEKEGLQRKPLAGNITPFFQRKETGGGEAPKQVASSLQSSSGGQPLPDNTRGWMESRFGADFSGVKIHTDPRATQLNRQLNAQAFTHGRDIYFNQGKYRPDTNNGKRLLAHELTHTIQQVSSPQNMLVQRMAPCPPGLDASDPVPSGWKAYHGNSCWFHCCYRGILEDRSPSPEDPQNECFYDDDGILVDGSHENAGCGGTPNQYDSASDWWSHTFEDEGGIWAKGWGAFWSSRGHDLNQHFEREGRRILECHEICEQQPWYLRGFCLQGCSGGPPM